MKNEQNRQKHHDMLVIFDDFYESFKENKFLDGAYEAIIKTIIRDIKKTEKKLKDKRLFTKLMITIVPFKYLQESIDFGLFY